MIVNNNKRVEECHFKCTGDKEGQKDKSIEEQMETWGKVDEMWSNGNIIKHAESIDNIFYIHLRVS